MFWKINKEMTISSQSVCWVGGKNILNKINKDKDFWCEVRVDLDLSGKT